LRHLSDAGLLVCQALVQIVGADLDECVAGEIIQSALLCKTLTATNTGCRECHAPECRLFCGHGVRRVSSNVNRPMPASIANTKTIACQWPVNRMVTAGPGQMPAIPKPTPNSRPARNAFSLSTFRFPTPRALSEPFPKRARWPGSVAYCGTAIHSLNVC